MVKLSKQDARRTIQARLDVITDDEYKVAAEAAYKNAADLLAGLRKTGTVKTVLSYYPVSKWREVDLTALEAEFAGIEFDYVPVRSDASLPMKAYDVVFVPLYGFSRIGYRLGHGGGWYDGYFAVHPQSIKIGTGLDANFIDFFVESYDVPMDVLVTEAQVVVVN